MLTPYILSLALPVLGDPTATNLAIGAQVDDRFGLQPRRQGDPPEPTNQLTLAVPTGLQIKDRRTSFLLKYVPRLTFQQPNPVHTLRPLVLQRLNASYSTQLDRRWTAQLSADGSYGEVSYANQSQVFEPGASLVDAETLSLFIIRGQGQLSYMASRRLSTGLSVEGEYQNRLESRDQDVDTRSSLPEIYDLAATWTGSYQLTQKDGLGSNLTVTRLVRDGTPTPSEDGEEVSTFDSLTLTALGVAATWYRTTSESSQFSFALGFNAAYRDQEKDVSYFPTIVFTRNIQYRALQQSWKSSFLAGIQGFIDQATGTFRPLATLRWSTNTLIHGQWVINPSLFASTAATEEPLNPTQYETTFGFQSPVTYRVTKQFSVRLGVSAQVRFGHWSQFQTPPAQPNFTGTLGLRYTTGTGGSRGSWL